jgi:RES domain-containing protein
MASVWRLAHTAYANILDGEGARMVGGRWNSPGRAAVYTSSHLSLCVLEAFVHIPPELRDDLPVMTAVRVGIPEDASGLEISAARFGDLMAGSNPVRGCRAIGDKWLERGQHLLLRAPSVLVPEETNIVLNPLHPQMRQVRIEASRPFRLDPRLVRTR